MSDSDDSDCQEVPMWVAAASSKFGSGLLADRRAADDAEQQRRREAASLRARAEAAARQREEAAAVSYTHLTLPTILLV